MTQPRRKPRNQLADLDVTDPEPVLEPAKKRTQSRKSRKSARSLPGKNRVKTDMRRASGDKGRLPPPVPKNKSIQEIHEMDPDDPAFKHKRGRPRKERDPDSLSDMMQADKQKRMNARRAKRRKNEAEIVKASEVLAERKLTPRDGTMDEELAIAEGILELDEWDNEELIRGFRRNRDGKFGKPPKYIPRELQQEMFRRIVQRGEGVMRKAYMDSIEALIRLASEATSEKVQLEAIKELMSRVVGKVPDVIISAQAKPYEDILADSIVPISDVPPIEMRVDDDGIARTDPLSE